VCNLGSINFSRIDDIDDLADVVHLSTLFLLCGTMVADLPYEKVQHVREKNRRLGLGIMGLHEWLLSRGSSYEVTPTLHQWLSVYKGISDDTSRQFANRLGVCQPVANRSIAPTGTIGMVAGTTTGIEPVYAVAYKRRYLKGTRWHYQYAIDSAAQDVINKLGIAPEKVESAIDLATDYERRIRFQADVQDYVDMAISSTINLPARDAQNVDATDFARTLAKYAPRLRGFTCYPDGSRGGQPLTSVSYEEAKAWLGTEFEERLEHNDVCSITGGGYCGS
jgi:ribonucleoside-diphosphate reductase alpha chain